MDCFHFNPHILIYKGDLSLFENTTKFIVFLILYILSLTYISLNILFHQIYLVRKTIFKESVILVSCNDFISRVWYSCGIDFRSWDQPLENFYLIIEHDLQKLYGVIEIILRNLYLVVELIPSKKLYFGWGISQFKISQFTCIMVFRT